MVQCGSGIGGRSYRTGCCALSQTFSVIWPHTLGPKCNRRLSRGSSGPASGGPLYLVRQASLVFLPTLWLTSRPNDEDVSGLRRHYSDVGELEITLAKRYCGGFDFVGELGARSVATLCLRREAVTQRHHGDRPAHSSDHRHCGNVLFHHVHAILFHQGHSDFSAPG